MATWLDRLIEGKAHVSELKSRLVIRLCLRAETGFLPGAGVEPGTSLKRLVTVKLAHNKREVPVLLASSLRGALRAISERLARTDPSAFTSTEAELKAVELHYEAPGKPLRHRGPDNKLREQEETLIEVLRALGLEGLELERLSQLAIMLGMSPDDVTEFVDSLSKAGHERLPDIKSLSEREKAFVAEVADRCLAMCCPICRLYGAPGLAGKLRAVDGLPREHDIRISVRAHVGIDRASGTHREDILYQEEVIEPGHTFTAYLIIDNIEPGSSEARLLASTLEFILKLGLKLGSSKSRGLGLLKLDDRSSIAWLCSFEDRSREEALDMLIDPSKGEKLSLEELIDRLRAS